jgi:hypothetical protein
VGKGKGVRRRGCGEWEGCEEEGESGGCEGGVNEGMSRREWERGVSVRGKIKRDLAYGISEGRKQE